MSGSFLCAVLIAEVTCLRLVEQNPDGFFFPRQHVDMDAALQRFTTWRHGLDTPSTLTSKTDYKTLLSQCVSDDILSPMPINANLAKYTEDPKLEKFFNAFDQIYVICVNCRIKTLPPSLARKALNVNGFKSDTCLNLKRADHCTKATAAHRLAVTHAQQQQHKNILIFEEDAYFETDTTQMDLDSPEDLVRSTEKTWQMMRMGFKYPDHAHCNKECQCSEWEAKNMCTVSYTGCTLRSSVGYGLPSRSFTEFITSPARCIDDGLMERFKQTFVYPALTYQRSKLFHMGMNANWAKLCMHHKKGE